MERLNKRRERTSKPAEHEELRERRLKQAFSVFGGPVEKHGDPKEVAKLADLLDPDPGLARALTHGFHSYAGRMHPGTARRVVERFSQPGQRVLDPFCGSGTVLVEAMAAGRKATGSDASPLAVIIASVRTSPLDFVGRQRLLEAAHAIEEASAERARKRQRPEIPKWAKSESDRFEPHVALELYGLRELIGQTDEDEVGRALRASLSSILVKFMRGKADEQPRRIGRGVPSHFFASRVEELAQSLEALERRVPAGTPIPKVRVADARHMPTVHDQSIDMILSSPPYAGTYDYAEHHDVRFLWLGLSREKLDLVQVGARDDGLGSAAAKWNNDRRCWLKEMARVTRPGAAIILQVGDGVVAGQAEDVTVNIEHDAKNLGLTPVARISQARPPRDQRLRTIFEGRPRREHIMLLRRG
jgi:SAM-dependent methyltransferase